MSKKKPPTTTGNGKQDFYNRHFEYERVVSTVSVTDEGLYQAGQVPDTYGGAQLDMQMVHAVFMVNGRGEMIMFEFETESPMDSDRKTGGPIVRDGTQIRAKVGTSDVPLIQTTIKNANLDASRLALGQAAKNKFNQDLADVPGQPLS